MRPPFLEDTFVSGLPRPEPDLLPPAGGWRPVFRAIAKSLVVRDQWQR